MTVTEAAVDRSVAYQATAAVCQGISWVPDFLLLHQRTSAASHGNCTNANLGQVKNGPESLAPAPRRAMPGCGHGSAQFSIASALRIYACRLFAVSAALQMPVTATSITDSVDKLRERKSHLHASYFKHQQLH